MSATHETRVIRSRIQALLDAKEKEIKAQINERQSTNRKIVAHISALVENYPDLRFGQIIDILELNREIFNEESAVTLNKIENKIANL